MQHKATEPPPFEIAAYDFGTEELESFVIYHVETAKEFIITEKTNVFLPCVFVILRKQHPAEGERDLPLAIPIMTRNFERLKHPIMRALGERMAQMLMYPVVVALVSEAWFAVCEPNNVVRAKDHPDRVEVIHVAAKTLVGKHCCWAELPIKREGDRMMPDGEMMPLHRSWDMNCDEIQDRLLDSFFMGFVDTATKLSS